MSAKDVIEKILRNNTRYVTQDDISSSPFVKTPEAIFEEDISDVAQQILDSLPRLSRDKVKEVLVKNMTKEIIEYDENGNKAYMGKELDWDRVITDICSLIPAGEVIAEGKVKDDAFEYAGGYKIGGKDIDSFFYEHHNQSGTLVWVPSKEDK